MNKKPVAPADVTWRIGVDVGGTFTDMIVAESNGDIGVHKVPSTPSDPGLGVIVALEQAADAKQMDLPAFLGRTSHFVHGSTIATNTVLEGKGARVGLLVTEGFRDFLEIRRGIRVNSWDHRSPYPPVLAPRYLRLPVRGRIDAKGAEVAPLALEDIDAAVAVFRDENLEAVAICFQNSFLNGEHEKIAAARVAELMPETLVSMSHAVAPIMGEFERGSTVVLNAYVAGRTIRYLRSLERRLADGGLRAPLLLIQNNGGSTSVAEIADRPVNLLLSGPAAGVGALRHYAESIGGDDLMSMEIGGTSCDVLLMSKGEVAFSDTLDIAGYTYVAPSVEVHTIGAGGGTIAAVDDAGLLQVGPTGAGARPGPACFGLGGDLPTVTDAHVVLGRLKPGVYANGAVKIDSALARASIETHLARPLGLSIEEAASGVIRLMEQKLLLAVQRLSTERGHDPKRFTLVAGGGAGPLHAASVGRTIGCRRVYIPRLSGAFCALGMLSADIRHDHVNFFDGDLDEIADAKVMKMFERLAAEATERLTREGFGPDATSVRHSLDLRYVGQQWDITIPVGAAFDRVSIRRNFDIEHDRLFGHTQPGGGIEIMKARVTGVGALPPLIHSAPGASCATPRAQESREIWIDREVGWRETPVLDGLTLGPGQVIVGPALINEPTTTVLVGMGDRLSVDASGNYSIEVGETP